jgi:hypothetical protein
MRTGLDAILGRTLDKISRRALITPLFEKALVTQDFPAEYSLTVCNKERIPDGLFHPSSDAAMAPLLLYYKFHPEYELQRERVAPQLSMAFHIGDAYHAFMQSTFIHLGFTTLEECEVSFRSEERHASGTVDIRKFFLPDGRSVPVELKSAARIPKEPYNNHVLQLQLYMDLGCEEPAEVGVLFYLEKTSPHKTTEFVIRRDEELLRSVYDKWDSVLEAIEFSDPSSFKNCCAPDTADHYTCPARLVCRIGPPTVKGGK